MRSYRLYLLASLFVIITIVALAYGRNIQWHTETVGAVTSQADEKSYQYWFPFIGERNGRSYLSLIVREHNPAIITPTPTLTGTLYPGPTNTPSYPGPLPTAPYPWPTTPVTPYPKPY